MNKIKFLINFLAFSRNPKRTELIFNFAEAIRRDPAKLSLLKQYEDTYLENPGFRQMWDERYDLNLTPETLQAMPEGSLGRAYLKFLQSHNLDLHFYPDVKIERPIDYFIHRQYKTHDLLHVLLDLDISHESELAVQAFTLAQTKSALPVIIIVAGLLHEAQNFPSQLVGHFKAMFRLFQKGDQLQPLYGLRLEDFLPLPLEQARAQLMQSGS